jgi:parallel beta-helix repeat protein
MSPSYFFVLLLFPTLLFSQSLVVDPKGEIQSLKTAISNANAGDTIFVRSGHYKEGNVLITKSLVIIGEGSPILDGEGKHEILTIRANDVTISGLKLINTGRGSINDIAAIKVSDSRRVRITGNILSKSFFGIHFSNSTDSWIMNNQLQSFATGEHEIFQSIIILLRATVMASISNLSRIHSSQTIEAKKICDTVFISCSPITMNIGTTPSSTTALVSRSCTPRM